MDIDTCVLNASGCRIIESDKSKTFHFVKPRDRSQDSNDVEPAVRLAIGCRSWTSKCKRWRTITDSSLSLAEALLTQQKKLDIANDVKKVTILTFVFRSGFINK